MTFSVRRSIIYILQRREPLRDSKIDILRADHTQSQTVYDRMSLVQVPHRRYESDRLPADRSL
jgi:hypothetical protein